MTTPPPPNELQQAVGRRPWAHPARQSTSLGDGCTPWRDRAGDCIADRDTARDRTYAAGDGDLLRSVFPPEGDNVYARFGSGGSMRFTNLCGSTFGSTFRATSIDGMRRTEALSCDVA
jgi:hypothetical protein